MATVMMRKFSQGVLPGLKKKAAGDGSSSSPRRTSAIAGNEIAPVRGVGDGLDQVADAVVADVRDRATGAVGAVVAEAVVADVETFTRCTK